MEFLNQLLAGFVDKFKAKNPKIYTLIMIALAVVYLACEMLLSGGVFDDTSLVPRIIQIIDVVFMALVGTKTAPYLKEYLDQVTTQNVTVKDNWWTSIVDQFKMKSPVAFGIMAVFLISVFVVGQYAIHFDLIYGEKVEKVIQYLSYVDIAVLVLLGTRTGQYLIDHPPVPEENKGVSTQSLGVRALYYD